VVDRKKGTYEFKVRVGKPADGFDPNKGTVVRTGAVCLLTGSPIPFDYVRDEGKAGRMYQQLMAIVCEGSRGRVYLSPTSYHGNIADCGLPDDYPASDIPEKALGFRIQLYGMNKHYKLFTPRQLTALTTFSDLVKEARQKVLEDALDSIQKTEDRRQEGAAGHSDSCLLTPDSCEAYAWGLRWISLRIIGPICAVGIILVNL
jgi:putative DNA methylase